jgi:hypothetical protein
LSSTAWLGGCVAPGGELGDENPKAPGEVLGLYAVAGTLGDDTCGAESLSAPSEWSFEVKLSRDGSTLYWLNGREAIVGEIDKSGGFSFETHLSQTVAERRGAAKGCTIVRRDRARGSLSPTATRPRATRTAPSTPAAPMALPKRYPARSATRSAASVFRASDDRAP